MDTYTYHVQEQAIAIAMPDDLTVPDQVQISKSLPDENEHTSCLQAFNAVNIWEIFNVGHMSIVNAGSQAYLMTQAKQWHFIYGYQLSVGAIHTYYIQMPMMAEWIVIGACPKIKDRFAANYHGSGFWKRNGCIGYTLDKFDNDKRVLRRQGKSFLYPGSDSQPVGMDYLMRKTTYQPIQINLKTKNNSFVALFNAVSIFDVDINEAQLHTDKNNMVQSSKVRIKSEEYQLAIGLYGSHIKNVSTWVSIAKYVVEEENYAYLVVQQSGLILISYCAYMLIVGVTTFVNHA